MYIPELKSKSPFFRDDQKNDPEKTATPLCDHPDCQNEAPYKAPKSRDQLNDHYNFCLDHVRDYNNSWNYFEGYSPAQMEDYLREAFSWERPTWKADIHPLFENKLRTRIAEDFDLNDMRFKFSGFDGKEDTKQNKRQIDEHSLEAQALDVFNLEPPIDLDHIKNRYKELVKQYHPDLNQDRKDECEDKIKSINAAYTVLKAAYARYETIKKD